MIIFIYGPDTYRSKEKLRQLKERFIKEVDTSGVNVTEIEGGGITAQKFQTVLASGGFLARKRMLVVYDFLSKGNSANKEQISELLPRAKEADNVIIFWEGEVDKRTSLYKNFSKEKYSYKFLPLDNNKLQKWVTDRVKERGGKIAGDAAQLLAAEVGSGLWKMSGEVDKLVAYKDKEVVSQDDVRELVRGKYEENIFALTDAVATRNRKLALMLVDHELASGMNEIYLVTMLTRQFRILLQLKGKLAETEGRVNQSAFAKDLGLHPFVVKKSLPQVGKYTYSELKGIYERLLDIDVKLKSTKVPAGVLFDLLVMGQG